MSEDPFVGVLKCLVLDDALQPSDGNVLIGKATLETYAGSATSLDAASYNAVGIEAIAGANNGDSTMLLGGPAAEYNACPDAGSLSHFFDGALEPLARASTTFTTLVLVPCTENLLGGTPTPVSVDYIVINEFEQQFGITRPFTGFQAQTLSSLSPIFSVGMAGTLAAQTRFRPTESGVVALAIQADQPAVGRPKTAAFGAYDIGLRPVADVICLDANCEIPTVPPTATPTATDTPMSTATHTPNPTAAATPTRTMTRSSTPTRTLTQTPVRTHGNAPPHGCCEKKNDKCSDKTEQACTASGGQFHPTKVCNKDTRQCEVP